MRLRKKPWARPELEACNFFVQNPKEYKGKWSSSFKNEGIMYLELGCGKGNFVSVHGARNKDKNYIAIDIKDEVLVLAKRNIERVYKENNEILDNVKLMAQEIGLINDILGEEDKIDRIYINFCNPWPRGKHHKKRLTHTKQLEKYKEFLIDGGEIYFKTDDDNLFEDSLVYFKEAGFEIIKKTHNLENEEDFWENIETEHEKMFKEQGIKIKALIAKKM